jgi:hypothetical protein
MDKHSKVALFCQFRQTFTMVKALVEMAIKPLVKISRVTYKLGNVETDKCQSGN